MSSLVISGKIGNKEIVTEDIQHFITSIKDCEWTDNNIYKPAKVVDVKPNFGGKMSLQINESYQPRNANFDQFLVEENVHLQDFQQYKVDIEDRKIQQIEKIQTKKKDFIHTFFTLNESLSENSKKEEIIECIKTNKVNIIINSNLNQKLGKYISYLTSIDSQTNLNMNYTFDFTQQKNIYN
jgi:hypothetical protein